MINMCSQRKRIHSYRPQTNTLPDIYIILVEQYQQPQNQNQITNTHCGCGRPTKSRGKPHFSRALSLCLYWGITLFKNKRARETSHNTQTTHDQNFRSMYYNVLLTCKTYFNAIPFYTYWFSDFYKIVPFVTADGCFFLNIFDFLISAYEEFQLIYPSIWVIDCVKTITIGSDIVDLYVHYVQ